MATVLNAHKISIQAMINAIFAVMSFQIAFNVGLKLLQIILILQDQLMHQLFVIVASLVYI